MSNALQAILNLPKAERLRIAMEILRSIEAEETVIPDWQIELAEKARQQAQADPESLLAEAEFWQAVDAKLKAITDA